MTVVKRYWSLDGLRIALLFVFAGAQIVAGRAPDLFDWGKSIGEQSTALATPIIPPGWAFAIWGVIFLGCLIACIYMASPKNLAKPLLRDVGWLLVAAYALNTAWELWVPVRSIDGVSVLILATTVTLLVLALHLMRQEEPLSTSERICIQYPVSLFAGWVTAALFVGLSSTLRFYGIAYTNADPSVLTSISLLVGAGLLAAAIITTVGNAIYAVGVLWALGSLLIDNIAQDGDLLLSAVVGILLLLLISLVVATSTRKQRLRHN